MSRDYDPTGSIHEAYYHNHWTESLIHPFTYRAAGYIKMLCPIFRHFIFTGKITNVQ